MFQLHTLLSLLPESGQALAVGLHPEMLQVWLDSLAGSPPEETAVALRERLKHLGLPGSLGIRLRMLDMLAAETRRVAADFETELDQAHYPLSVPLQIKVAAGNDLLKAHAQAYRAAALRLRKRWAGREKSRLLRHSLAQAMDMERRRLVLAYRAHAPGARSAWRNLHSLYRIARNEGQHDPAGGEDSPHRIYAMTLLLAQADPERMPPGELDRVRFYLERHAHLAEFQPVSWPLREIDFREACFLIRRDDAGPGRSLQKWQHIAPKDDDILLDCSPLLRLLRSQIDALEFGALPSKIGLPSVARRPHYVAMLKHLQALWGAPPTRRSTRQRFHPRVELCVGLDDLWSLLSGAALRRRRDDSADATAAQAVEVSEWSVDNESPTGFALHYVNGESHALAVGALVGVRAPDKGRIHVCVVRRLVSGISRRTELGLEKIAGFGIPTTITWGGSAAASRPPARAIVLPRMPSLAGGAAVIAAPQVLRSGKRVPYVEDGRSLTRLAGAPIERTATYDLLALGEAD